MKVGAWLAVGAHAAAFGTATGAGCTDGPDLRCSEHCQCEQRGLCGQLRGKCVPTKAEHCSASKQCELYGTCTLKENACVVGSDADCASSERCSRLGKCVASAGACVSH